MSGAYYNEHEPFAAQWLRNLITAGHIAPGDVDERDIQDVQPDDLRGYTQCHFFAGIGGWSCALRLAGWPDDRVVWTGSCPCQPFSSAGKGGGKDDARHLWPQFRRLIRQCRPPVVFGEQVASQAGRVWLSAVFADLEALAYRAAGADLCGPSVGAFDIRQRLWFVADSEVRRRRARRERSQVQGGTEQERQTEQPDRCSAARIVADAEHAKRRPLGEHREDGRDGQDGGRPQAHGESGARGEVRDLADTESQHGGLLLQQRGPRQAGAESLGGGEAGELGHANGAGLAQRATERGQDHGAVGTLQGQTAERASAGAGFLGDAYGEREDQERGIPARSATECARGAWADTEWIPCTDGKWRPTQPGLFPLAARVPGRVGRLRGYGNAIKPPVAAAFIEAYDDIAGATARERGGRHGE